jgi:HEPN domain-containing protein
MSDPKAEARRWIEAAREDLDAARHLASGKHHAQACFHSQQVAEKAVTAVHYARGARVVIGHSVRGLIEQLEPCTAALSALLDAARELDLLYVPTRYPNGLDQGTPAQTFSAAQSARALDLAARFLDAVEPLPGTGR